MDILREVMDASTHAMFLTDAHGIVTHINTQAQERFGLAGQSSRSHKAGRLSTGDIVILADTAIGADDGELTPTDLAHLRIQERKLRSGDMVAAVGVYDDPNSDTVYKFIPGSDASVMTLRTVYHGLSISIEIGEREVSVTVDGAVYSIRYFLCIGQMVVLDGATHQVKFWEERGYTAKKEGIGRKVQREKSGLSGGHRGTLLSPLSGGGAVPPTSGSGAGRQLARPPGSALRHQRLHIGGVHPAHSRR